MKKTGTGYLQEELEKMRSNDRKVLEYSFRYLLLKQRMACSLLGLLTGDCIYQPMKIFQSRATFWPSFVKQALFGFV